MNNTARLVTLAAALAAYPGVSLRTGRALIASGRLPAAKIGREYFVDPSDVANLFKPVLRVPSADIVRGEGPTARENRQLAASGIVVPSGGAVRRDC
jgi:excisionase family DNA binding protein